MEPHIRRAKRKGTRQQDFQEDEGLRGAAPVKVGSGAERRTVHATASPIPRLGAGLEAQGVSRLVQEVEERHRVLDMRRRGQPQQPQHLGRTRSTAGLELWTLYSAPLAEGHLPAIVPSAQSVPGGVTHCRKHLTANGGWKRKHRCICESNLAAYGKGRAE